MTEYFEDVAVGETRELGSFTLSRSDIVTFGERYDPLPFHTGEQAGVETPYEGVIASGWQTAASCQRLVVDRFLGDAACVSGRGVDDLRFHRPVRPGDTVEVRMEVVGTEPEPDPSRGLLHVRVEGHLDDALANSMTILPILERREG